MLGEDILACESGTVRLLAPDLTDRWVLNGKSPLVAPPLLLPEGLYLQFVENTLYLVDPATGAIRANYTFYGDNPISYAVLTAPVPYGEKVAFGFSNGQVILFVHRVERTSGVEEILPYNKYQTGDGRMSFLDKREFFDVFSLLPVAEGMFLFSNGEASGLLRAGDGTVTRFEKHLRNLRFEPFGGDEVVAYGEGGAWLLSKDGTVRREVLKSGSFVSDYVPAGGYAFLAETGGAVTLYDAALSAPLDSVRIPQGVSGRAAWDGDALYLLSDMGVLYSFGVVERQKVQKILAKETKAGNNSADLSSK